MKTIEEMVYDLSLVYMTRMPSQREEYCIQKAREMVKVWANAFPKLIPNEDVIVNGPALLRNTDTEQAKAITKPTKRGTYEKGKKSSQEGHQKSGQKDC